MPRLLLVDDNPSIHRIAESLLAPTAIELVCVESAAEALARIQRGETFDVAMVDTAMPGMDGWTLVEHLRALDATARMPIALMAGVLDPVDPGKPERAPIQGFLKKPIELRDLADRVAALAATPVGAPAPPVEAHATQPISKAEAQAALAAFPDFTPTIALPEEDEDLLVLTEEDLLPEPALEAALPEGTDSPRDVSLSRVSAERIPRGLEDTKEEVVVAPIPALEPELDLAPAADLELEELDLEGLQGLAAEVPEEIPVPLSIPESEALPAPVVPEEELTRETPELPVLETYGAEDLSALLEAEPLPEVEPFEPAPEAASPVEIPLLVEDVLEEEEPILLEEASIEVEPAGVPAQMDPWAEAVPASTAFEPSPTPAALPEAPVDAQALVQAILDDPRAMDALAKALVARLGEDQLKAIAWEVMPDLAKKLS